MSHGQCLERAAERTRQYIERQPKAKRKAFGQFFTPKAVARFMAGMFDLPRQESVSILDPGAGTGLLSVALVERLQSHCRHIDLTCYETNLDVVPLLRENLSRLAGCVSCELSFRVLTENYITSQADDFNGSLLASAAPRKYDLIVGNPPYMKLPKVAPESAAMSAVCHGAPNLYFLFAAMGVYNLRDGGEMVYIMPRSWTSGAYFRRFRRYLLDSTRIAGIHLFSNRGDVFGGESVLQETIILKVRKTRDAVPLVRLTSSAGAGSLATATELLVPYGTVVSGEEDYVFLPTSPAELEALRKVNAAGAPMPRLGLQMRTGLTVDFRNRELLRDVHGRHTVPLFYAQHLRDGRVDFPIGKPNEYIADTASGVVQRNQNYLFVKRFTSKEEPRRLQCAVYLAEKYKQYAQISTDNKLNFIDTTDGSAMSDRLAFGLYAVLNSSVYDTYYRVLNGSTQVNATEMNTVPMPDRAALERLGDYLMAADDYSTARCDLALEEIVYA